jgi:hypothetical protein
LQSASVRPSTVSRIKVHWSNVRVIPSLRRCEYAVVNVMVN